MNNVRVARAVEHNYGMLPMPKYNEQQARYRSLISTHQAHGVNIPVTTPDLERSAIIMEALSAESRYTVIPTYFEISLAMQTARDDESAEMLSYIFDNAVIDPILIYNFGDVIAPFHMLSATSNANIQSFYESRIGTIEQSIQSMIDSLNR
jgi:hypothetical protein